MSKLGAFAFLLAVWNICAGFFQQVSVGSEPFPVPVPVQAYDLDSATVMRLILSGPAPTKQDLLGTWTVDSVFIQYKAPAFEGQELYTEMEDMGFPYSFYEDGTFAIDAFIDTEGTWSLNENTRIISVRDTKGRLELDDYLVIHGNVMQWITFRDGDIYISLFHKGEQN